MKILKMKPGDSNFHLFENLPKQLYSKTTTSPKEKVNKDFLIDCYVLLEGEEPKARLALYQNPHLFHQEMPTACLGYYECVEDLTVSNKIITYVSNEAKDLGAKFLIGPMNGSTWNNYRFSTNHTTANFFLEPYHHLYYNKQFTSAGYKVLSKYFSGLDTKMSYDHPTILKREAELLQNGLRIRSIDLADYENELKKLYPFISNAFKRNFLYSPITWESFQEKYSAAKEVIDPQFVLLAEDKEDKLVGIFFCVPDLLNTGEKSLIVKTIARHPDRKWARLGHVLANQTVRLATKKGFSSMVHAFLKDDGTSRGVSKHFSGQSYKNYILYGKEIK